MSRGYIRNIIGHKSANSSWGGQGKSPKSIVRHDRDEPKKLKTPGICHC